MADETTNTENNDAKPQAAAPSGDALSIALLAEQLEATRTERDANAQKVLLAQADLENYRRRLQKEMDEERKYRVLPIARDLLPVLDNLLRALDAAKQSNDLNQLVQGVQMVAKQFTDVLARQNVTPIESVGKPLDPNLHQAIQQIPTPDKPPLTVLTEVERGYVLHDRVVRPSTVIVAAPPAE